MPILPSGAFLLRSDIETRISTVFRFLEYAEKTGQMNNPAVDEWRDELANYQSIISEGESS